MSTDKPVESLVLDATPLLTQSASALQQFAAKYYTTPGVKAELRDESARNQLLLWGDSLVVRQPKQEFIDKVSAFARLTGDYSVLSMNDIHIIALAYEIEHEKNGDAQLRKFPGQKLGNEEEEQQQAKKEYRPRVNQAETENESKSQETPKEETQQQHQEEEEEDDGFQVVRGKNNNHRRYRKRGQGKYENKESKTETTQPVEASESEQTQEPEQVKVESSNETESTEAETPETQESVEDEEAEDFDEDDDGDWITPGNLQEVMMKDNNETVRDAQIEKQEPISVAISTGDFACQNVLMQIGLKLMNHLSGKQIKSVKNFMYRCHACFTMVPMPKLGQRKHFCPKCGGDTLLRCAVSIDNVTGKVTPHLKSNMKWITRGQVYSLASPLSKNTQKRQGNAGHQHNKENRHKVLQEPVILREDQREYSDAIKEDAWRRRKSEKMLQEFVGGGSADNFISPFGTSHRSSGVRVGRGRNANASRGKKK